MGVHGDLSLSWRKASREVLEMAEAIKYEETEEDRLMKELIKIQRMIGTLVLSDLAVLKERQGIKNPMVIKTTKLLKKYLAEKINILKEMIALTEKQMKQDTQEYELEEKAA